MGATDCVLSDAGIKDKLMGMEKWGYDYTFDCTGNVNVMRCALEVAHRGWGESCVIGVAAAGKEIATRFDQETFLEIVKSTSNFSEHVCKPSATPLPHGINCSNLGHRDREI